MSVNIRDAAKAIRWNIGAGITTLVRSDPGMGKTDMMGLITKWWQGVPENQGKRLGLAGAFMATQSPISATGLPWKGERVWKHPLTGKEVTYTVTDPAIPGWYMATDLATGEVLPASLFDHVLLVIEEWGQGNADTKRAFAEILRARGTPPYYLPQGSACVALSNTSQRDGVTKEFDFTINRVNILDMHGDAKIWVEDFADHPYMWNGKQWMVTPFSKNLALQHGMEQMLFEPKPDVQGPWSTARSYTNMDRLIQVATKENGGKVPVDSSLLVECATGLVGTNMTTKYFAQLQFAIKLPSKDDVVKDPAGTEVPKQSDLQMLMAYELAARVDPHELPPVLQYINRLNDGLNQVFVGSLMRKDWRTFSAEPAMKAWVSKNAALISVVSSIAQGM